MKWSSKFSLATVAGITALTYSLGAFAQDVTGAGAIISCAFVF